MSKASEWAAAVKASNEQRPAFNPGLEANARVTERGQCEVEGTFDAKSALKLAHWIIDTFGDEPAR